MIPKPRFLSYFWCTIEVIFEGKIKFAVDWHPALENKNSEEYKNVSANFLALVCVGYVECIISSDIIWIKCC